MSSRSDSNSTEPPSPQARSPSQPPQPTSQGGALPSLVNLADASKRQKMRTDDASGAGGAGAASSANALWTFTQMNAKCYYVEAGPSNTIGSGAKGEMRKYQFGDRWFAIKEFHDLEEGRLEAKTEVENHIKVWQQSDGECRKYMSEPAEMAWETAEKGVVTYTVQSLIQAPGMTLQTFHKLRERDGSLLRPLMSQMSTKRKVDICKAYGAMRACIAKAGVVHNDLHTRNVLCLTNYPMDDASLLEYTDCTGVMLKPNKMVDSVQIEWRVVDWGSAEVYKGVDENHDEICWQSNDCNPTDNATHDAMLGYWDSDYGCQTERRDDVTEQLHPFLFATDNFDCSQAVTELDCVTIADVYHWVQEGFANALNKKIPADLAEATQRKARSDRAARRFSADA